MTKDDDQELASVAEKIGKKTENNYAYVNVAGDSKQYFPKELDNDSCVILAKNKYLIAFAPINLEETQGDINKTDKKEIFREEKDDEKETQSISKEEKNGETEFQEDVTEEQTVNKLEELEKNNEQEEKDIQENASLKIKDNAVLKNKLSYMNKNEDIAYQYTSLKNGIKEEIVLESSPEVNCFDFKMNLSGVEIVENEYSKEIQLVDKKTKKLVAVINEPSIKDAEGNILYNEIKYKIRRNKDKEKILSIQIDKEYLQSEKTKYPIVVDPTVWWVNDRLPSVIVSNFPYTHS